MSGNSHQRRRSNRHWRHVYHLENVSPRGIQALYIRQWCEQQFGKKNYAYTWAVQTLSEENWPTHFFIAFNRDKDASWFSMNWLS